ncbi:MAG: CPBP family intramembrane metalloprotease [Candidatus Eremiobacteraeota bacterium]|nr:CPBP family intramembrane metalloprotease [Candidatus Eremiobacteraeota bacterium]MBC5826509.1 CPBP family intramembrane metalloprotease [Candidatus Eremiobacteraeota bacterium]
MQSAIPPVPPDAVAELPVPGESRWNGWGCAGIGCLSFAVFVIAQVVLTFVLIIVHYPGFWHSMELGVVPKSMIAQLQNARGLAKLLSPGNLVLLGVVSDGALVLVAVGLARTAFRARLESFGLRGPFEWKRVALGVPAGVVLLGASAIAEALQTKLVGPHPQMVAQILATRHGLPSFLLDFLAVSLIAPAAEEIFFRGFLFAGLAQRMPIIAAALISGAIFGAAHLDPWNFVPLFTIGVGLAYLYRFTGVLWSNMVAHSTVNTISLIAAYLYPQLVK